MNLLYIAVALELFIGGGGRLLEVGPVTVRMLLFAVVMAMVVATVWLRPNQRGNFLVAVVWVLVYLTIHVLVLVRGLVGGSDAIEALADMQPTLYWIAAPFFALAMESRRNITRTVDLVILAGMILAVGYLATISSVLLGYVDPFTLWETLLPSGEFFFRNELLFFYKGDLYLGIAVIFLLAGCRSRPLMLAIIAIALLLTLTRGFVIATTLAATLMYASQRRMKRVFSVFAVVAILLLGLQAILDSAGTGALGDRSDSDAQRFDDLRYMAEHLTIGTLLIGEGFGTLINSRMNVETSFLWLLWKGGLITLVFWLMPLWFCWSAYRRIPRSSEDYPVACAFLFSVVFIYVQTATNPFLNNPIGLSFVMIAMFALRTLAGSSRVPVHGRQFRGATPAPAAGIAT